VEIAHAPPKVNAAIGVFKSKGPSDGFEITASGWCQKPSAYSHRDAL
jgi:hypothetical protein